MGKRIGLARTQALLENLKREIDLSDTSLKNLGGSGYSSDDAWGLVRPAMVPGLNRNHRVVALGQMHGYGFEDFTDLPVDGQTTAIWLREDENSAAIALVANDADFTDGGLTMTPGSGAEDQVGLMTANKAFQCTTNKPFWVETSIKLADIDDCEFFFGLEEQNYTTGQIYATQAAAAGKDAAGFVKAVHSSGAITVKQHLNSDGSISRALDSGITLTANNDVLTMGIYWDGVKTVRYYAAFAATGNEVGDLPLVLEVTDYIPDQKMALVLQMNHTTGAADDPLTVNYIRGCWTI
jgi:hypothetical protein